MAQSSHVLAEDPAVDIAVVAAIVEELETYIVKDDLYRTVLVRTPRGDEKVTMTGGDLLARLHRLRGEFAQLTVAQQGQVDTLQQRAERIIYSLKTRFHARLQREMTARMSALRWYLDDCAGDPQRCRTNYPYEIRNRQRIEEILKELGSDLPAEELSKLHGIDQRIRQLTHGTTFIWDARFAPIFPPAPYWYLYVMP